MSESRAVGARPCRWCAANYGEYADDELCEASHRHPAAEIAPLAEKLASVFQQRNPTDQQIGYFMQDADEVIDDFDPRPEKWRVRKLSSTENDEFIQRFRINDVTYVIEDGEGYIPPVRLSTVRQWQREAERGA